VVEVDEALVDRVGVRAGRVLRKELLVQLGGGMMQVGLTLVMLRFGLGSGTVGGGSNGVAGCMPAINQGGMELVGLHSISSCR